jgi:hypothetical protein
LTGRLLHWNGTTRSRLASNTANVLSAVWGSDALLGEGGLPLGAVGGADAEAGASAPK